MVEYQYLTMKEIMQLLHDLRDKIVKSGFKPDCLVGMSRGGFIPVRILSDILDVGDVYIIGVTYYRDIEVTKKEPEITQDIDKKDLKGKTILLVDDVSDTGKSLKFTVNHLNQNGIKFSKTATLHLKPWSVFIPDYYAKTTKKWIIYEWEIAEIIRKILKKFKTQDKIKEELSRTGIPEEIIKRYANI